MINETWYAGVDGAGNNTVTLGRDGCGCLIGRYMRIIIKGDDDKHEKQVAKLMSKAPQMLKMLKKLLDEEHDASKSSMKRILELETLIVECGVEL